MKKSIKLLAVFFSIMSCLCLFTGCKKKEYSTETEPTKYLKFSLLEDGTYQVDGFVDLPVLHLVIPSTYNNTPVTKIKEKAFVPKKGIWGRVYTAPIKSVVIEDGITTVGAEAFVECGAESFVLPDSITYVGYEPFNSNETYTINFPKNLKYIGVDAFRHANFTEDEIELNGIELNSSSFTESNIKKVVLSDYKELPSHIFSYCWNLEEVFLPAEIEIIPSFAFEYCSSLKEIVIEENIKEIEEYAFANSGLEKVSFLGENIRIKTAAFGGCKNLNSLELNDVYIDESKMASAFVSSPLNNITVSESSRYKLIDGAICIESGQITKLLLGRSNFDSFDQINFIEGYAFSRCCFDELLIPNTVSLIHAFAFSDTVIETLKCYAKTIGGEAFSYATIKNASIFSEKISVVAFEHVKELKTLHIENGCKEIESEAFACLFELEEVYISETVEKINTAAFIQCHSLKDVYYLKKEAPLVDLHAGTFVIYISNIVTEDHRIKATINDDFKIHVSNQIYDECVNLWSDMESDSKYIYYKSLKDHIVADID